MFSRFLLRLRRRFDEWVVGTADHVAQGSAGGDHGIDGIFLFDTEVDQHGFGRFAGGADSWHHFTTLGDAFAANAECIGERGKIRRHERSGDVALVVEELLPLADHTQKPVVDDGDLDVDFFLDDGGQLAHGHLESAIARHDPDFSFGFRELCPNGRRKGKAHGAESAGSDQRARAIVVVILRFPHLVLADVSDYDGFAASFFPDVVDDMGGVQVAAIGQALNVADRRITFQRLRSEEHTSELQSLAYLVCRLLLEKKKKITNFTLYLQKKNSIKKTKK